MKHETKTVTESDGIVYESVRRSNRQITSEEEEAMEASASLSEEFKRIMDAKLPLAEADGEPLDYGGSIEIGLTGEDKWVGLVNLQISLGYLGNDSKEVLDKIRGLLEKLREETVTKEMKELLMALESYADEHIRLCKEQGVPPVRDGETAAELAARETMIEYGFENELFGIASDAVARMVIEKVKAD